MGPKIGTITMASRLTIHKRSKLIGSVIGFLIATIILAPLVPFTFEPTDAPRFEDVKVVSYRTNSRHWEWFTVVSTSGQSYEVGAAGGIYPPEYRGAAILSIRRGRWTGEDHLLLLNAKNQ